MGQKLLNMTFCALGVNKNSRKILYYRPGETLTLIERQSAFNASISRPPVDNTNLRQKTTPDNREPDKTGPENTKPDRDSTHGLRACRNN